MKTKCQKRCEIRGSESCGYQGLLLPAGSCRPVFRSLLASTDVRSRLLHLTSVHPLTAQIAKFLIYVISLTLILFPPSYAPICTKLFSLIYFAYIFYVSFYVRGGDLQLMPSVSIYVSRSCVMAWRWLELTVETSFHINKTIYWCVGCNCAYLKIL
jgi:hypothetical protein